MQLKARGYSSEPSPLDILLSQQGLASIMTSELERLDSDDIIPVPVNASLYDALERMNDHQVEVLGVYTAGRRQKVLCGVISREAINHYLNSASQQRV